MGEKTFLSAGDRWEFVWFCESAPGEIGGVATVDLNPRVQKESETADGTGKMDRVAGAVELARRVSSILERMIRVDPVDGPEYVLMLFEAYVFPAVVTGAGVCGVPMRKEDGQRWIYELRSGAKVQCHNHRPTNSIGSIPGLVCIEGDGRIAHAYRAELAAACAAYRRSREALRLPERPYGEFRVSFAEAAEIRGVARSTITREASKIRFEEATPKHGGKKKYKSLVISTDDGTELGYDLDELLERVEGVRDRFKKRIAAFAK